MPDHTTLLLIWRAMQACGMDYVTVSLIEIAMPFVREQGSVNA